eukprot:731-Heterococcus_DN1.PRE.3
MLGSLSDALARRAGIERSRTETNVTSPGGSGSANNSITSSSAVSPKDSNVHRVQMFLNLKLNVQCGLAVALTCPSGTGYALKCQAKRAILDNDLQSHVLEERKHYDSATVVDPALLSLLKLVSVLGGTIEKLLVYICAGIGTAITNLTVIMRTTATALVTAKT